MDKTSDLKKIILNTLDSNKALDIISIDLANKKTYWYKLDTYKDKPKTFKVTSKRHPTDTFPTNNNVRKNNE